MFDIEKYISKFEVLATERFKTKQILKNGWKFCFIICIISLTLLVTYNIFVHNLLFYRLGISLFKLSMIFAIEFLICGYVVDSIKKGEI